MSAFLPIVQSGSTTASTSFTLANPSIAGDILVIAFGGSAITTDTPPTVPDSCTDNNGNVYDYAGTGAWATSEGDRGGGICALYVGPIVTVTPNNPLTVTLSGGMNLGQAGTPSIVWAELPAPSSYAITAGFTDQENGIIAVNLGVVTGPGSPGISGFTFFNSNGHTSRNECQIVLIASPTEALLIGACYTQQNQLTDTQWSVGDGSGGSPVMIGQTSENGGSHSGAGYPPGGLGLAYMDVDYTDDVCGYIAPALGMTCNSPPDGTEGVPYSWQLGPATGGTPPYTYAITAGDLPTGITLDDSTGVVSGTPTATGTFDFTVTATDSASDTASADCSITISAASVLVVNCNNPPGGIVGIAYLHTMGASGGTPPYTFVIVTPGTGPLPPGLTMNSAGVISGTPTTAGTYPFEVQATDADGLVGTVDCSITISSIPPGSENVYFSLQHVVVGLKTARLPVRGSAT